MKPFPAINTKKNYTLLSLGDSYTIGEKLPEADNYPHQLVTLLSKDGFTFKPPTVVAKTGWTTQELIAGIKRARPGKKYDFVTLLIGVNNQYRGLDITEYMADFESLLKQAIIFAGGQKDHVVVLSIPDWSVTPFAHDRNKDQIAKEIDEFNAANKLITEKNQVPYIYITAGTRKAANEPDLIASDGLHPSAKEYARWAEETAAIIRKKL